MKLLALDQASRTTGFAIFDNDKLIKYGKFTTEQEEINERLHTIRKEINKIITDYSIDQVIFEDIQLQEKVEGKESVNSVVVFKTLSEVFGVVSELITARKLPQMTVVPSSWKSILKIKGKQRSEQKRNAKAFVENTYNVKCTQDEADAICIGTYHLVQSKVIKRPKDPTNLGEVGFDWS